MRAVIQRVREASVSVGGSEVGEIGPGLVVLVGVGDGDRPEDAAALVDKMLDLRIFPDRERRMNLSVVDTGGAVLVISQFTLLGDVRKGRRPSFTAAAAPERASPLVDEVVARVAARGVPVAAGVFGAMMEVRLVNSGPVTIVMDIVGGRVH
jgi:D-tyrosyl-tRNA(Tyr) deacylase